MTTISVGQEGSAADGEIAVESNTRHNRFSINSTTKLQSAAQGSSPRANSNKQSAAWRKPTQLTTTGHYTVTVKYRSLHAKNLLVILTPSSNSNSNSNNKLASVKANYWKSAIGQGVKVPSPDVFALHMGYRIAAKKKNMGAIMWSITVQKTAASSKFWLTKP